jgi:hypothetical protein
MLLSGFRKFGLAVIALIVCAGAASSQGAFPPPAGAPPGQNPVCVRLETQLTAVNRGTNDPARAEQIFRQEEAVNKQQFELDRLVAQSRRAGCEGLGFFSLFVGQPAQCSQINPQIQQMRANLDRLLADLERLKGFGNDRDGQRQSIILALTQNNCGAQYRSTVTQPRGGFFDSLFGNSGGFSDSQSSGFRTLCVRVCDGFYFPISFQAPQSRFRDDEQICQRTCPAAEVMLFSHRNPGEDVAQAVSISGRLYTELPQAFKYRTEFNSACSCRRAGQSWAEALGQMRDTTLERGDIVVTGERAKAMSQPLPAQGRPLRQDSRSAAPAPQPAPVPVAPADKPADTPTSVETPDQQGKRAVRTVGPPFLPAR